MSKKSKWRLVLIISIVVWIAGIFYLNNLYNAKWEIDQGGGFKTVVGKPIRINPRTGKSEEMPFIEAKANELFLLTLICGVAAAVAIRKARKSRSDDKGQDA